MYLFLTITLTYFNNNLKIMNFLNIISWKASHHCKLFFSSWWIRQISKENHRSKGNSLAVQRLGLHALTAEDLGSIPGQGTKIPQALWRGHKTKQNKTITKKQKQGIWKVKHGFFISAMLDIHQEIHFGTSLVVQWVRLHAPNAGHPGPNPSQGTRSRMPASTKIPHATTKTRHSQNK